MVVLAATFWLQSRKIFPGRSDLVIFQTTSSGCFLVSPCASCCARSRVWSEERSPQGCVQLHPLAATGDREHLEPQLGQPVAHHQRDLGALAQPCPVAGVEVDDQAVGVVARAVVVDRPLGHVPRWS